MLREICAIGLVCAWINSTFATNLPSVPSGQVVVHLDAGAGITANGSNVVTHWADQSGFACDFGLAEGNPTLVPNVLNGKPAVRFTPAAGDRDRLTPANSNITTIGMTYQPLTVFVVSKSANTLGGLLSTNPGNAGDWRFLSSIVQIPGDDDSPTVPTLVGGSVTTVRQDAAGSYSTYLNSALADTANPSNNNNPGGIFNVTFAIGAFGPNNDPTSNLNGDLLEFVIYKGALDPADRVVIENALMSSFAVPEPGSVLALLGLCGFMIRTRR